MKINSWYTLDRDSVDDFADECSMNKFLVETMLKRFKVVSMMDNGEDEWVQSIMFEGSTEVFTRNEYLPNVGDRYTLEGQGWIYDHEFKYFEKVIAPLVHPVKVIVPKNEDEPEFDEDHDDGKECKDCIIVVTSDSESYTVGRIDASPILFTLKEAKAHAEFVLSDNAIDTEVAIFRLETTARVESKINFD